MGTINADCDVETPSVYVVYSGDKALYVGASVNPRARVANHNKADEINSHHRLSISTIDCELDRLRLMEIEKIIELDPVYNIRVVGWGRIPVHEKRFGLNEDQVKILQLKAEGISIKDIAKLFGKSYYTIKDQIFGYEADPGILNKMKADTLHRAVVIAWYHKIIY